MKTFALRSALATLALALVTTAASAATPMSTLASSNSHALPGRLGVAINASTSLHTLGPRLVEATVTDVQPGSPAEAAGLQVGDRILRLDGAKIAGSSVRAFKASVLSVAAGEHRQMTVRRADGRIDAIDVVAAP